MPPKDLPSTSSSDPPVIVRDGTYVVLHAECGRLSASFSFQRCHRAAHHLMCGDGSDWWQRESENASQTCPRLPSSAHYVPTQTQRIRSLRMFTVRKYNVHREEQMERSLWGVWNLWSLFCVLSFSLASPSATPKKLGTQRSWQKKHSAVSLSDKKKKRESVSACLPACQS